MSSEEPRPEEPSPTPDSPLENAETLSSPAPHSPKTSSSIGASSESSTDVAGRSIGPYRLVHEIGRGGQGIVYLAEDTRLSRRVALKVIASHFAPTGSTLARFHREAENASRLDHPGICAVYEAGEADGVHFIAMRFVSGTTLRQRLRAQRSAAAHTRRVSPSSSRRLRTARRRRLPRLLLPHRVTTRHPFRRVEPT